MRMRRTKMFLLPAFLLLFLLFIGGFFGTFQQRKTDDPNTRNNNHIDQDRVYISHDEIRITVEELVGDRSSLVELDIDTLDRNMLSVEISYTLDLTGEEQYTREDVLKQARDIMGELFEADNVGQVILTGRVSPDNAGRFPEDGTVYRIRGTRERFEKVNLHELDIREFEEHLNEIWIHERLDKKTSL